MSNVVEGKIEEIEVGKQVTTDKGVCCNYVLKVNGGYYTLYCGLKKGGALKVGDDIKFEFTLNTYQGATSNKIDVKTIESAAIPKYTGNGGGYASKGKSPEEQMLILKQSCLKASIEFINIKVTHGAIDKTKLTVSTVETIADAFFKWCNGPKVEAAPAKQPVQQADTTIVDDDLPF